MIVSICEAQTVDMDCEELRNQCKVPLFVIEETISVYTYEFLQNFFYNLIFIAFFLLRKPHDCFECLSIDATKRISIFQLSHEELKVRQDPMLGKGYKSTIAFGGVSINMYMSSGHGLQKSEDNPDASFLEKIAGSMSDAHISDRPYTRQLTHEMFIDSKDTEL